MPRGRMQLYNLSHRIRLLGSCSEAVSLWPISAGRWSDGMGRQASNAILRQSSTWMYML